VIGVGDFYFCYGIWGFDVQEALSNRVTGRASLVFSFLIAYLVDEKRRYQFFILFLI
jgi:hypothetical protein